MPREGAVPCHVNVRSLGAIRSACAYHPVIFTAPRRDQLKRLRAASTEAASALTCARDQLKPRQQGQGGGGTYACSTPVRSPLVCRAQLIRCRTHHTVSPTNASASAT